MDKDEEIKGIISRLDSLISKEGAVVMLNHFEENDGNFIEANQKGYQRFAISLLKASFLGDGYSENIEDTSFIGMNNLFSKKSDIQLDHWALNEDLDKETIETDYKNSLGSYVGMVLLISIPVFYLIALITIFGWIF